MNRSHSNWDRTQGILLSKQSGIEIPTHEDHDHDDTAEEGHGRDERRQSADDRRRAIYADVARAGRVKHESERVRTALDGR